MALFFFDSSQAYGFFMLKRQKTPVQSGVYGRAYFVGHLGQKGGFYMAGVLGFLTLVFFGDIAQESFMDGEILVFAVNARSPSLHSRMARRESKRTTPMVMPSSTMGQSMNERIPPRCR